MKIQQPQTSGEAVENLVSDQEITPLALKRVPDLVSLVWKLKSFFASTGIEPNVLAAISAIAAKDRSALNQPNAAGLTAVELSIIAELPEMLAFLLAKGATLPCVAKDGQPLLCLAAAMPSNSYELTAILLDAGSNPNAVGHLDQTPLSLAVTNKNQLLVDLLLRSGANPNADCRHAWSPYPTPVLALAILSSAPATLIRSLIESGADPRRDAISSAGLGHGFGPPIDPAVVVLLSAAIAKLNAIDSYTSLQANTTGPTRPSSKNQRL